MHRSSLHYIRRRLPTLNIPRCASSASKIPRRLRCGSLRRHIRLGHPAVNGEIRAVDKARLVAGQEQYGLRLFDGFAEAAGREVDFAAVAFGDVVAEPVLEERGA